MDTLKVHKRHGGAAIGPWAWENDGDAADVPYDDAVKLLATPGGEFYLAGEEPAAAAAAKAATSPGFTADPEPGPGHAPEHAPEQPEDSPGHDPEHESEHAPEHGAGHEPEQDTAPKPAPRRPAKPRPAAAK